MKKTDLLIIILIITVITVPLLIAYFRDYKDNPKDFKRSFKNGIRIGSKILIFALLFFTIKTIEKLVNPPKENHKIKITESKEILPTSQITFSDKNKSFVIRNSEARKYQDELIINFVNDVEYFFEITNSKNKTSIKFDEFSVPNDSSYKKPVFKILQQKIIFNRKNYNKGDSLKATVDINILANYKSDKPTIDTINIKGIIKNIVK